MGKTSYFRQSRVLISRYFNLIFNDKQNLLLKLAIPLLTILIVCYVVCPKMYSVEPNNEHSINDGYPVLVWQNVVQEQKDKETDEINTIKATKSSVSKWNGESYKAPTIPMKSDNENYFMINSADEFAFLSAVTNNEMYKDYEDYLSYNYILQVDINLDNHEFDPIGNSETPFTGTFDGNGHKISNVEIDCSDNAGLFGVVEKATNIDEKVEIADEELTFKQQGVVKNFEIKASSITSTGLSAGAVVGKANDGATIKNIAVRDTEITAKSGVLGGIVGLASGEDTDIYFCYTVATLTPSDSCGGIVGNLKNARLSACYSLSKIGSASGEKHIGAVVGEVENAEDQILNCYYDNEKQTDYKAVDNKDYDGCAIGVTTEDMYHNSSMMSPFEDVEEDLEDTLYGFKKDGQLDVFSDTQTGLFYLVCVAIFIGICNSIQEVCKERNILKREYMANLRLSSYVTSKLVVQACICLVQMLLVVTIFYLFVSGKKLPESGVIFSNVWIEYYISLFLLSFTADVIALVISSVVKTSASANNFIPIILIVQILFSGISFKMTGFIEKLSYFMISKYGMDALAISSRLNDAQQIFLIEHPDYQLQLGDSLSAVKESYMATPGNLLITWLCFVIFIVICTVACLILLRAVKKDRR